MSAAAAESPVRLNRYLAMCGVAARRKADELVAAGRVKVNGEVPPVGGRLVRPGVDEVEVDGRRVAPVARHSNWLVNKPAGVLTAVSDRGRRPLVTSLVPRERRGGLHPVGRLDLRSRGLVLLTDDGELSFRLQHPRHHVEKEYWVMARGELDDEALARLRSGIALEEGLTGTAGVERLPGDGREGTLLRVVLRQGWKRQVRRMLAEVGATVVDLRRVRVGPLELGDLPEGRSRELTAAEVAALRAAVGLS